MEFSYGSPRPPLSSIQKIIEINLSLVMLIFQHLEINYYIA